VYHSTPGSSVIKKQKGQTVDSVAAVDERLGVEHLRERREPSLGHVLQLWEESRGVQQRPGRLTAGGSVNLTEIDRDG
jgi:hypothetical protein